MRFVIALIFTLLSVKAFAIGCDCEVRVYSPISASHKLPASSLKIYELEEFNSYSPRNHKVCKKSCLDTFMEDMSSDRLSALLLAHTQVLIKEGVLGYNCTGQTVVKYPVRVKANLGKMGLGNVVDLVQIVTHVEDCF
ncbi:MAG: hypothetical protein ACLGHN_04405 [Bacteriovoracia bacterium]